jgi:polysaccharide pyruvyl transferase WcaK-like protein
MVSFVDWLLEREFSIRLLIGDSNDAPYLERVLELVRALHPDLEPSRLIGEPALDLHQLTDQIADVEVVVAARFHNIVASLRLGTPVIALSYGPKALSVLEQFGLSSFAHPIEAIDLPRLEAQFEDLYERRAEIRKDLRDRVADAEARVRSQGDQFVREFLRS